MDKDAVLKLAKLARIDMPDTEAESLSHEFESILKYVADIKNVGEVEASAPEPKNFPLRNVLREDINPHESGIYTKEILAQAPLRQGEYIKVKKIL